MDFIVRQAGDGNPHPAFPDDVPDVDKQTNLAYYRLGTLATRGVAHNR